MSTSTVNSGNTDQENILDRVMDQIKAISSAILSVSFALYSIGYVIININLSKYGAHEISLLEPSYLLSGILFLFVWLIPISIPVIIVIAISTKPYEGMDDYRVIRTGDPKLKREMEQKYSQEEWKTYDYNETKTRAGGFFRDLIKYGVGDLWNRIGILGQALFYYFVSMLFTIIIIFPTVENAGNLEVTISFSFLGFVIIQLITLFLTVSAYINTPFRSVFDPIRKRLLVLALISLFSLFLFVNVVFPRIPAVLGGGLPQKVCLGMVDIAPGPMMRDLGITLSGNWTGDVDLIFEGENTVTIQVGNRSSARIEKDLIDSIRYNCS